MYILFAYIQSIFICVFDILMFIVMIIYIYIALCVVGARKTPIDIIFCMDGIKKSYQLAINLRDLRVCRLDLSDLSSTVI